MQCPAALELQGQQAGGGEAGGSGSGGGGAGGAAGGVDAVSAFLACLRTDRPDGLWTTVVCDTMGIALGLVSMAHGSRMVRTISKRRVVFIAHGSRMVRTI